MVISLISCGHFKGTGGSLSDRREGANGADPFLGWPLSLQRCGVNLCPWRLQYSPFLRQARFAHHPLITESPQNNLSRSWDASIEWLKLHYALNAFKSDIKIMAVPGLSIVTFPTDHYRLVRSQTSPNHPARSISIFSFSSIKKFKSGS